MKQTDILKIMSTELGTSDVAELNKLLKTSGPQGIKFRLAGKKIGHFGFTGPIKMITAEGLKVFDVSKVTLIKFEDIESFEKAKPRVERPKRPKLAKENTKLNSKVNKVKSSFDKTESDDDDEDDDIDSDDVDSEVEWAPKKKRAPKKLPTTGSIYFKAKRR